MSGDMPTPDQGVAIVAAVMALVLAWRKLQAAGLSVSTKLWMAFLWLGLIVGLSLLAARII